MELTCFQIDAFTDRVFGGNPACVVVLREWLPESLLLSIASENAVAETAFFIPSEGNIQLRWFTPEIEMDLCGHATLATAFVLKNFLGYQPSGVAFDTLSGELRVNYEADQIVLNFPSRKPVAADLPALIRQALNIEPSEVYKARDYLLVYESEEVIRRIRINRPLFDQINLDPGGVIVTARGNNSDFISRYFTPQASILEDPVTGSAHCSLIPYWSHRLSKTNMTAYQLSKRGGKLACTNIGERVLIGGMAKPYSRGILWVE